MLQIFQSFIRWLPVGTGSYFIITLLSSSQWHQAAIVLCTTLGWLGLTYIKAQTLLQSLLNLLEAAKSFIAKIAIAILYATIGIFIGALCGGGVCLVVSFIAIPFDLSWLTTDRTLKGFMVIGEVIGGIIYFFIGLAKAWE
jgi:uncharacterized protein YacL